MIIHLVRALYLVVVLAFTTSFALHKKVYGHGATYVTLYILIPVAAAFALVMVDMFWRKKQLQALSGLFFGLVAGLGIAYVLTHIVDLVGNVFTPVVEPVIVGTGQTGTVGPSAPRGEAPPPATPSPAAPSAPSSLPAGAPATAPAADAARTPAYPMPERTAAGPPIRPVLDLVKVLLGASAVFMCVSFVLQTKDDFRFVIPYVEFARESKGARPLLLDTSAIIDGRIADVADTRVLESEVVVPRCVLTELHAIADSDDKLKRNRGRRGLDVLNRLRASKKLDIRILETKVSGLDDVEDVDARLLTLARKLQGRIITTDYNLNKIAQLRGVDVININDLANALKPVVLPGEELAVKVIKPGEEAGQGVGYLDDGTMVVAEQGRDYIGKDVVILVTSVLQTSAGRMIFGRLHGDRMFGGRNRRP